MRAFEVIKIGSELLKNKKIQSHILDSELLLSKTIKKSREEILVNLDQIIDKKSFLIFKKYIKIYLQTTLKILTLLMQNIEIELLNLSLLQLLTFSELFRAGLL